MNTMFDESLFYSNCDVCLSLKPQSIVSTCSKEFETRAQQ